MTLFFSHNRVAKQKHDESRTLGKIQRTPFAAYGAALRGIHQQRNFGTRLYRGLL
jgi:hypothetical protein